SSFAGIYINFQSTTGPELPLEEYLGLASDELIFGQDPQFYPEYVIYASNSLVASDAQAGSFWSSMYGAQSLYQINVCLEGIRGNSAVSAPLNRQLMGELHVLRAFYYFQLANLFGGVPLVTSTNYAATQ